MPSNWLTQASYHGNEGRDTGTNFSSELGSGTFATSARALETEVSSDERVGNRIVESIDSTHSWYVEWGVGRGACRFGALTTNERWGGEERGRGDDQGERWRRRQKSEPFEGRKIPFMREWRLGGRRRRRRSRRLKKQESFSDGPFYLFFRISPSTVHRSWGGTKGREQGRQPSLR